MANLRTSESTSYDDLFAGLNREGIKTYPVIVASGQNLKRGDLVTFSSGKVSAVSSTSDEVFGVMCDDVDASNADTMGAVYVTGDFNSGAIGIAQSVGTTANFIKAARDVGIFLR